MQNTSEKMLEMLLKNGRINADDVKAMKMLEIQEVLMENSVITPKITERKKGNVTQYYCVLPARYSRDGKRHQIVCSTPEEVEEKFQQEAYDTITGAKDIKTLTVADVMHEWLQVKKEGIKPQTLSGYYGHYIKYVKDSAFGQSCIDGVRLPECQSFIDSFYKKGLSQGTLRHIKSEMSMVFEYAIAHDYILRNYFKSVNINGNLCSTKRTHTTDAWNDEELLKLWDTSVKLWKEKKMYRHSAEMMFLAFSGCRAGELVAATWDDVDFENRTLDISKTHTQYKDYETGEYICENSSPKTETSRRIIKLNIVALYWLKEIKRRALEKGIDSNFITVSRRNLLVDQSDLDNRFKVFCKVAGVKYKPSHSGRKTYTSIMLDGDLPVTDISADLGHKDITTTQNIYYKKRSNEDEMLSQKDAVVLATVGNRLVEAETRI